MALDPGAIHRLLPENDFQSFIAPTQVILHTALDGPGPSTLFPYFERKDVTKESHFFVKNDGMREQYMDTVRRADANVKANKRPDGTGAISVETEDDGHPEERPWTPQQVASIKRLIDWACKTHNIPRRVCRNPDDPGIGYHTMWGAPSAWTVVPGKTCPGPVRIAQFKEIIVPWLLASGQPAPTPVEEDDMRMFQSKESGAVLLVTGGAAVLVVNNAEKDGLVADGIPLSDVGGPQFLRIEKLRVDV